MSAPPLSKQQPTRYVGRFAPSPTGPLHFGSLLTAFASYCDAKAHSGQWLLRIEDTDIARIYPDSERQIIDTLHAFGFQSDSPVIFQRQRLAYYEQALNQLAEQHLIYGCQCSRKQLASHGYTHYPNTCRVHNLPLDNHAIRLKVADELICFYDAVQGHYCSNLQQDLGDFVLKRRDGIVSYQLAVVVDDARQGVTHVVRGADLLDNTPRQIWLGRCLKAPPLQYLHLPLAMNANGQKLSKQNLAAPLDSNQAALLLAQAASALGQTALAPDRPDIMLAQAVSQWQRDRIPRVLTGVYQ